MADLGRQVEQIADTNAQFMTRAERKNLIKEALAEAIKDWLNERYRSVGKWTLRGISAAAFAALVYFILTHSGWAHK